MSWSTDPVPSDEDEEVLKYFCTIHFSIIYYLLSIIYYLLCARASWLPLSIEWSLRLFNENCSLVLIWKRVDQKASFSSDGGHDDAVCSSHHHHPYQTWFLTASQNIRIGAGRGGSRHSSPFTHFCSQNEMLTFTFTTHHESSLSVKSSEWRSKVQFKSRGN